MLIGSVVSLAIGFVLLITGAALLVRGASRLARSLRISPLVIGLTVVAYGTSAPELVVSVDATLGGNPGIALGNVVGSNIFNILAILGISALVAPLAVSSKLVRIDVPLMIGVSVVLLVMALDGTIGLIDGVLLVIGLAVYTGATWVWQSRSRSEDPVNAGAPSVKRAGYGIRPLVLDLGAIVLGLLMLVLGARLAVSGAVELAMALQISTLIVGLTVVAAGTSLPELATSVLASFRGERDLAVGNVVGSNIFNVLGVQGIASLFSSSGVPVDPSVVNFDMPVMIAVAVACLPVFFTGYAIVRWEGILFVGYFLAYLVYLYLQASQREALGLFSTAMLGFVIPITIVTLAVVVVREVRAKKARA